ncbi:hypothetical protein R3P38DRAFT_2784705 [Favolaschia claudopus]|uniref:Uncharacterized protein n=1 Tax=Favolaschia claudopus TaxID=2862362 RepID=A0AAW0AXD7_9AGAR
MPSTRITVNPDSAIHKELYCRLYSTTHAPRYTTTPTNCTTPTGLGKRYPVVESMFLDQKSQPYVHDAHVEVDHNGVTYSFQVYFKRGVVLAQNHLAPELQSSVVITRLSQVDGTTVINAHRSAEERDVMDFVFEQLRPTIAHFQTKKYFTKRALEFQY